MKIFVRAKPNAKEEKIDKIDENHYSVSVKEPPVKGEANAAIIKALAKYFKISPFRVDIVSGHTSRNKIIKIL